MKHLSYWAKRHPLKARAVIVAAHALAMTLAFASGIWFYACCGVAWPMWAFPLIVALMAWARSAYPAARPRGTADPAAADRRYWRARRAIGGATACAWSLVLLLGNHVAQESERPDEAPEAVSERPAPTAYGQMPLLMTEGAKPDRVRTTFKWLKVKQKKWARKQVQQLRRHAAQGAAGSMDPVAQVLLTLLIVVAAAFLEMLVLILACDLSCSGQETAALLVGVLGTGLIVWGAVAGIIAIWRKSDAEGGPPGAPAPPRRSPSKKL
jgi:hypothetical protein